MQGEESTSNLSIIFRSQDQDVSKIFPNIYKQPYVVNGPWRIFPGKLSVEYSLIDRYHEASEIFLLKIQSLEGILIYSLQSLK